MFVSQFVLPVISAVTINNHVNQVVDFWADGSSLTQSKVKSVKELARKHISENYNLIITQAQDEAYTASPTLKQDIEHNAINIAESMTDSFLLNKFKRQIRS